LYRSEGMTTEDLRLIAEARELLGSGRAARIREAARLSQSEVAAALGVQPSSVSRWESGERRPSAGVAKRFAKLMRALEEGVAEAVT
jgi:transcriptional regulator with XRE-family HTH domain